MEKELTEREAIKQLDAEYAARCQEIHERHKDEKKLGRDGGDTQELRELDKEFGKRYFGIKEKYADKH